MLRYWISGYGPVTFICHLRHRTNQKHHVLHVVPQIRDKVSLRIKVAATKTFNAQLSYFWSD